MAQTALAIIDEQPSLSLDLPKDQTFEDWAETGRNLATGHKVLNWWIGDWWAAGSHRYGERAKVAAQGLFGREFQSLANMASVCRSFTPSRRREVLSFSHHAEVAALAPAKADALLDRAESEGWSVRDLRAEAILAREHTPRWFESKPPVRYDRDKAKEAIFDKLSEAAERGAICPTADDLQEVAGVESVSTTVALMHVLETEGRIKVQRYQKSRQVTIVATGKSTAEPSNKTPHFRDLPGHMPTVSVHAFLERHPDKAAVVHAGAKRLGISPQDFLNDRTVSGIELWEIEVEFYERNDSTLDG